MLGLVFSLFAQVIVLLVELTVMLIRLLIWVSVVTFNALARALERSGR
jgi:hypothetical protein